MASFTVRNTNNPTDGILNFWVGERMGIQGANRDLGGYSRTDLDNLYVNFPEKIHNIGNTGYSPSAANKKCVFQKSLAAGSYYLYFSHTNHTNTAFKYGIHFENPNNRSSMAIKYKFGFESGWDAEKAIIAFLGDTTADARSIPAGGTLMLRECECKKNLPFTGNLQFTLQDPMIIRTFIYTDISQVSTTHTPVPYTTDFAGYLSSNGTGEKDMKVYTGYGSDGYKLSKTITATIEPITVNNSTNLGKKNLWLMTGEPSDLDPGFNQAKLELTPLTLQNGQVAKIDATGTNAANLKNLGNWATHYTLTLKVENKTASARTVYGFVSGKSRVVLKSANIGSKVLESDAINSNGDTIHRTWRFFQETVPANSIKYFDYTFIPASYGASATAHMFSLSAEGYAPPSPV